MRGGVWTRLRANASSISKPSIPSLFLANVRALGNNGFTATEAG